MYLLLLKDLDGGLYVELLKIKKAPHLRCKQGGFPIPEGSGLIESYHVFVINLKINNCGSIDFIPNA